MIDNTMRNKDECIYNKFIKQDIEKQKDFAKTTVYVLTVMVV